MRVDVDPAWGHPIAGARPAPKDLMEPIHTTEQPCTRLMCSCQKWRERKENS